MTKMRSNIPPSSRIGAACRKKTCYRLESKRHLDQAIRRLPEKLRVVFLLRDIEGLSIRETSETLGLTETAVKTRLLRARLNLREQLSSYYGERLNKEQA